MDILRHYEGVPAAFKGGAAALGNFDGFHRGHQVVAGETGRLARKEQVPLAVVVSEPHPRTFFNPGAEPFRLTGFRERLALFETFGVDLALVLPFTQELASFPPEKFVSEVLHRGLGLKHVVVGYDYRFGKARAGDASALKSLGATCGIRVHAISPVPFGIEGAAGVPYSSTLVRDALKKGEARKAAAMLGHWWTVNGKIDPGERRGRRIGFPTSNVAFAETLIPRHGVYAIRARLEGAGEQLFEGAANIGVRPTFGESKVLLEAHLFDFKGEHYGRHIQVHFVAWILPEQKFADLEALKAQLARDCETARVLLADPENADGHLPPPTLAAYLAAHPEGR